MTERYEKIRKALEMGPTPGPWAACRTNSGTFVKSTRLAGYFVEVRHCRAAQNVDADAHLIAACDPDTIRELLDERDALAAKVERLRADRDSWEQQASDRVADWHAEHLRAERLAEALEDIRSRSCMNLAMNPDLYDLTALLGDIYQIADAVLRKENNND
jgi:hypothetical protein